MSLPPIQEPTVCYACGLSSTYCNASGGKLLHPLPPKFNKRGIPEEWSENKIIKLPSGTFYCNTDFDGFRCGCNVFRQSLSTGKYKCNACSTQYRGEE